MEVVSFNQDNARYITLEDLLVTTELIEGICTQARAPNSMLSRYEMAYIRSIHATELTQHAIKNIDCDRLTHGDIYRQIDATVHEGARPLGWLERLFYYTAVNRLAVEASRLTIYQVRFLGRLADKVAFTQYGSRRRSPSQPVYETQELVVLLSRRGHVSLMSFEHDSSWSSEKSVAEVKGLEHSIISLIIEREAHEMIQRKEPLWMRFLQATQGLVVIVS